MDWPALLENPFLESLEVASKGGTIDQLEVYLDGNRVHYMNLEYKRVSGEPKCQLRLVLENGQVINVAVENERWTFIQGKPTRLEASIG